MPQSASVGPSPYTVADVATLLSCSPQHVRTLLRQKRIPGGLRVGRLIRFVRSDVDAWLAAARVQAGEGKGG